jgi:hypothetical protein
MINMNFTMEHLSDETKRLLLNPSEMRSNFVSSISKEALDKLYSTYGFPNKPAPKDQGKVYISGMLTGYKHKPLENVSDGLEPIYDRKYSRYKNTAHNYMKTLGLYKNTVIMDDTYIVTPEEDYIPMLFVPERENSWEQTKFVSTGDNPPSKSKRNQLRAKRKKRNK